MTSDERERRGIKAAVAADPAKGWQVVKEEDEREPRARDLRYSSDPRATRQLAAQTWIAMNGDVEQSIRHELEPDERLVWVGRPRTGIRLYSGDVLLIPFSLVWCGGAVYWEKSVLERGAPGLFALYGLPFIAIGLYLVFGRFVVDALRRQRTFYGLTSRRAIIVSGLFTQEVTSLQLESLGEISVTERRDHSGTISLGRPTNTSGWGANMMAPSWPGAAKTLPPSFESIEDVRSVYERIRGCQRAIEAGD